MDLLLTQIVNVSFGLKTAAISTIFLTILVFNQIIKVGPKINE